jgi:hypothetical protein
MKGDSVQPFRECGSLTAPVAGYVADGVEVILGAQDQALANEGWGGQRHCRGRWNRAIRIYRQRGSRTSGLLRHTTGICNRPNFHSLLNGSICSNDAIIVGAFPDSSSV